MGKQMSGVYKDVVVAARITREQLRWIDSKRGALSRSEWIRAVILREMRQG